jgi:hypothetical protein
VSKDSEFKTELAKELNHFPAYAPKYGKTFRRAQEALRRGEVTKDVYRAFNIAIADKGQLSSEWPKQSKKYMEFMRKKGYGAIRDVNDMKYSGYRAHNPLIVFSAADAEVKSVEKMGRARIAVNAVPQVLKTTLRAPDILASVGVAGAINAANKQSTRKRNDKIVREYRKEHPNTQLSYQEIVRNWERARIEN